MTENSADKRCRIAAYLPLIRAADGLTLSQICALSGLETSTIQNWIKRGFVPHPVRKKYRERHLARILLISALRESMQIDRIGELLRSVNGDTDDESDDIITEENLYDIFTEIADGLDERMPAPDRTGEIVSEVLDGYPEISEHRGRIAAALTVMANTYMANLYKRKAEAFFTLPIKE